MNTKIRTLAALTAGTVVTVTMLSGPAFAAGEPTESTFSSAEIGAIKAASDPDPFTAKEIDEARAESATKDKRLGIAGGVGTLDVPPPPPASSYLADNHVAQAYSNYCGPATARMTLLHQGKNYSQATLAGRFGITPNNGGTSWDAMLSALKNLSGVGYAGEFLAYRAPSGARQCRAAPRRHPPEPPPPRPRPRSRSRPDRNPRTSVRSTAPRPGPPRGRNTITGPSRA
ncbi:hypothetical protein ACFCZV_15495 [Streptomyces hydrogenans]|uniref:hypothetical protein n=1 Tax=Streptomyces hydrogenans TaxID=1873719 RepID=UPI0035E3AAAC